MNRSTVNSLRVSGIAAIAAVLASCSQTASEAEREPVEYMMDYPAYSSLDGLCSAANLVVVGTPVSSEVRNVNILAEDQGDTPEENPNLGTENKGPEDGYMVHTVTTLKVDTVVHGDAAEGDLIEVGQPGGLYEDVEYLADQFPLEDGSSYLLFLEEYETAPANLLNPADAGFEVTPVGVKSTSADVSLLTEINRLTLDEGLCS